ncbi:MAG: LpxL/LpxP family Kdo(2)-lipid IV(A) lauroyl/palmitoleoyl acyltransferase [Gammaproteobacteria bacterium]
MTVANRFSWRFLAPRYWPTWLALGFMWLLAQLPYRRQMSLGRTLGRLMERLGKARAHVARVNLALCLPELSDAERERLLQQHLESMGMALVETAISWWTPAERLRPLLHIDGLEHLHAALQKGRGAIVLFGHFTCIELFSRLLALHTPLYVSYRQNKNALYEYMLLRSHRDHCAALIPHTNLRAMFQVLKRNQSLAYAPDQNYAGKHSAFVPFFGVPASTITATSRIAKTSGAPVIPVLAQRLPDDRGYRITLQTPLQDFPGDDEVSDAARIMRLIEDQARQIPEQYLWVHRRFKTRPPGDKPVY